MGTLGGTYSSAFGINASGEVTGSSLTADGVEHVFLFSNGRMSDLGTLGGGYSAGFGINAVGQIAGYSFTPDGSYHAAVFRVGKSADLGTLGGINSMAEAINDSSLITGYSETPAGSRQAFVYRDGKMSSLGTLGGENSAGFGINNGGQVTGRSETLNGAVHAFLFSAGRMRDLHRTSGAANSCGLGINSWGQVVGELEPGTETRRAFIFSDGMMQDLNTMVSPGWNLLSAGGINDQGQIVGTGLFNGQETAFQLTPIIPRLKDLGLSPARPFGGQSVTLTLTLSSPAPPRGVSVSLTSSDPQAARVPPTIFVPAGSSTASVTLLTTPVSVLTNVAVSATLGSSRMAATLTLQIPMVKMLSLSPATVKGGQQNSTGTVFLTSRACAPTGTLVVLSNQSPEGAIVPASIIVPPGATQAVFPVTSKVVTTSRMTTIFAATGGVSKSATLTVTP